MSLPEYYLCRLGRHLTFIVLLLLLTLYSSCTDYREVLNEEILSAVKDDLKFDQKEYESVSKIITSHPDEFPSLVNDSGSVISSKLKDYIINLSGRKKMKLSEEQVWTPDTKPAAKFEMNVFLENSASMDGYVAGATEFESTIFTLLSDVKQAPFCSAINLNYINAMVVNTQLNASDRQTEDFIRNLEPADFRKRGGTRSSSDIRSVIETALNTVDETHGAMLITDAVFSPGKGVNAAEYLNTQQVGLKNMFESRLKKFPVSVYLLQLYSSFTGTYYDRLNAKHYLKSVSRPYYILFIATPGQMKQILASNDIREAKMQPHKSLLLEPVLTDELAVKMKIVPGKERMGRFKNDEYDPDHTLTECEVQEQGKYAGRFGFSLLADFSAHYYSEEYLTNTANYSVSSAGYTVSAVVRTDPSQAKMVGFSHELRLHTTELREETITVSLLETIPSWINTSTTEDDLLIDRLENEQQKTFGLSALAEGIFDAYRRYNNSNAKIPGQYERCQMIIHIKP